MARGLGRNPVRWQVSRLPSRDQAERLTNANLFAGLLPDFVAVAESDTVDIDGETWPEEDQSLIRAAEKRRLEFRAGRILARRAIAQLGLPAGPILRGPDRAPIWPAGIVGSITHCGRRLAAAAARAAHAANIGIDVEEIVRFRPDLERSIADDEEIAAALQGWPPDLRSANLAAIFCIKEAFYKAQRPLSGAWLGFHDVRLQLDQAGGIFNLTLLKDVRPLPSGAMFSGRYRIVDGLVAAALLIPAARSAASRCEPLGGPIHDPQL